MQRMKNVLPLLMSLMTLGLLAGRAQAAPFDQAFIDAMVPHHQSAVMMAQMAVKKAPHAAVKSLARQMIHDQQREIAQLKAWRKAWYGSAETPMMHGSMAGHKMRMMSGSMMGLPMKGEMDMSKLMALSGRAFEREFLRMMVPHHAGAIMMAREALHVTARPHIRRLSHQIMDAQAKEIGQLHALHHRWYGAM